jgi:LmbE family N-acetylglucosaminyl deacetylase
VSGTAALSSDGPVIVSPHLDDVVLSAALQLMRPGARVVTVCTGAPPEGTPLAVWDRLTRASSPQARVRERYAEDDAALQELGIGASTRLGLPDGQHIPHGSPRPSHEAFTAALAPHLAGVAEVWAPAGIGCHPDHLAVRDAVLAAVEPHTVVHHYADVPYSVRYGWPPSVTSAPTPAFLDVELWLAEELAGTGLDARHLTRTVHRLDVERQHAKRAAVARYATQIPALDYGTALTDGDPSVIGFEISWTTTATGADQ